MGSRGEAEDPIVISRPDDSNNGQTLRMVTTLSAITLRPVRIENLRAFKKPPGLMHPSFSTNDIIQAKNCANNSVGMTASLIAIVGWLKDITGAEVEGNELQSQTLTFRPKHRPSHKLIKKEIKIDSGSMTASSSLFLQTMLPVLLFVGGDSKRDKPIEIRIDGATNCLEAPSYDYLDQIFFPALESYYGIKIGRQLTKRGWGQMTPNARVIQKGTIRVKFMPLDSETTLRLRDDFKLCDQEEEGAEKFLGDTDANYIERPQSIDNNILSIVATIVTPTAMHEPLQAALTEEIEVRFPGAESVFNTEESGHIDRFYVMLVAQAKHCRWGCDYINSDRLKDVNIASLSKEIASQLAKNLEDESNGDCPIDEFLQDQLVVYQCLAEGRSCFPRPRKDQTAEFAMGSLHPDFPLTEDSAVNMAKENSTIGDSWHTRMARYAAAMVLPDAKFYNDGKVCIGAGVKAAVSNAGGRGRK